VTQRLVRGVREWAPALLSRRTFLLLVLPVFAVAYFVGAERIHSPPAELQVSARAFPMLVGAALIASALFIAWEELREARRPEQAAEPVDELEELESEGESEIKSWRHFWLGVAGVIAMVVLLDDLGFVISATALVAGLAIYLERGHVVRNLTAALGYVALLFYLFDRVFDIPLPSGPLPW
jgi:putative tricarboxylic transport membrane protein